MLDYIFFHEKPFLLFIDFLKALKLAPNTITSEDGFEVQLPEDIDDVLSEKIEAEYDRLFAMNQALMEEQESLMDDFSTAGVVVNLKDGSTSYADINGQLLGKIMGVLTPEEFGDIVNAIADAVEKPDTRSLCQRMRDQEST